jgi:hypothetical protein
VDSKHGQLLSGRDFGFGAGARLPLLVDVLPGEGQQSVPLAQVSRSHVAGDDLLAVVAREPAALAVPDPLSVIPACKRKNIRSFNFILVWPRISQTCRPVPFQRDADAVSE